MRAIGQRRGSMRHVQNFARLRIILRRIQGSPPHVPKSNQITQGNVEAKVGHRADNGVLAPLNLASYVEVLRLVTRSCGKERVTSSRTSAWEATLNPEGVSIFSPKSLAKGVIEEEPLIAGQG